MCQLLMLLQLFDDIFQLTKVSLGLSVGTLIVTFTVIGAFILNIRQHMHPQSITVGTSTKLNLRWHIHPHSVAVGITVHPHSFSVGTSIHAQSPSAHPFNLNIGRHIHLFSSTLYMSTNLFIRDPSSMAKNDQKVSCAPRANSLFPYYPLLYLK